MYTILELLNDKNFCLEKFYKINETEIENFNKGQFDHLEEFYKNRDGLLNIVKKIDDLVEVGNGEAIEVIQVDVEIKAKISDALEYKNVLVNKILEQDLQILAAIELAKSKIIKDLSQVRATKKALGSYKSGKARSRYNEKV